jgi:hypothetical protein
MQTREFTLGGGGGGVTARPGSELVPGATGALPLTTTGAGELLDLPAATSPIIATPPTESTPSNATTAITGAAALLEGGDRTGKPCGGRCIGAPGGLTNVVLPQ